MYEIIWVVMYALVLTLSFYGIVHGTWWVLTKCVSWLLRLLRIGKNNKEQTEGNTMVGDAKNLFEKREKHHVI